MAAPPPPSGASHHDDAAAGSSSSSSLGRNGSNEKEILSDTEEANPLHKPPTNRSSAEKPGFREGLARDEMVGQGRDPASPSVPSSPVPGPNPMGRTTTSATDASVATSVGAAGRKIVAEVEKEWKSRPWYRKMNPLRWRSIPQVPEERTPCPEATASIPNRLLFSWMSPFMSTGYLRPLQETDIWSVSPKRSVEPLSDRVRLAFRRRVDSGEDKPLLWALNEAFFAEFWLGGFFGLISTLLQVLSPFVLRFLIQFATDAYVAQTRGTPGPNIGNGLGLAIGVTAMQVVQSLCMNHFIYRGMAVGGESRAALISLVYEKSMVLSGRARAGGAAPTKKEEDGDKKKKKGGPPTPDGTGWGNGRIVNLMSVDTYRIDLACGMFHIVWTAPLSMLITLALLVVNIGYSALAGFAILAVGMPLTARAMKSLFLRRKAVNKLTDQRVSLTQEILSAVRFVKFFGWESAFLKRLQGLRSQEIRGIQLLMSLRNLVLAIGLSLPIFAAMLAFITYSLTDHSLNPAEVFSSLALFNGLRMPLNMLPMVLGQVTDAWSSMQRIEEFLLAEELEEQVLLKSDGENAVEMHAASFTWEQPPKNQEEKEKGGKKPAKKDPHPPKVSTSSSEEESEPFKLQGLDLEIGRNELVAVIGTVGSGKSSLLAALAGDMRKTEGEVVLGASRAFCPQYAWIQNATVRDNILFGKEMDREWYEEVVHACALEPDMDMLPNGDLTEIGERGITISGGQKQRLNIARAIYFDAGIVVMDDPLSAVDAHVGRHIFDHAILGLLGNKCRVLATHQLWVLNRCDRIVWMEAGRIQAVGTFDGLMRDNAGFRHLMEKQALEEKEKERLEKKKKKDVAVDPSEEKKGDEEEDSDEEEEEEQEKKVEKKKKLNFKKKGSALMQTEERAVASVPWSVYTDFLKASGSYFNAPLVFFLLILAQGSNIITSLWLSWWSSDRFALTTAVYVGIYAALGVIQVLLTFGFMVALTIMGTHASKIMLHRAVQRVLRAPMSFFDTTPLGRITNRFSRDVDVMDNTLMDAMRTYFFLLSSIVSVFALIIAFFPYFAAALGPLFLMFLMATAYYRASAREVKRFESTLRSMMFAKFGEALSGVATIRAYGLRERFVADMRRAVDDMDSAYFLTFSNQRWLSVRLDMIGNTLVLVTGILVTTSRFSVNPAIGGLVLSYILGIVQMLQFTIRQLAEVENGMNAVERIRYYGRDLEEEAPLQTGVEVPASWPEKGQIDFENVEMRYRAGLPLVLKGLDMSVRGGERIGIVGRTGAGKSSIMSTLFRLVELSGGSIKIDGVDISTIGLGDLRSRMAIIPQDPTLFKGTVRSNLDPFGEHSDLALWDALRQADLVGPAEAEKEKEGERSTTDGVVVPAAAAGNSSSPPRIHLDTAVEEDGLNFSLGQRQLMALARALVRGSRIIVCDEATSSVDMETDAKIQATMAVGFKGKTLLCIAHRLRTIVGYDRICVMDAGRIAEIDEPLALYQREGGIFRAMCERSGIREEDIRLAREGLGLTAVV